jgi:hypothetical protein
MIATVTCDDGAGEGAGVGAGEGAGVDDGVGALGDVPPHAVRVRVAAATADIKSGNRMTEIGASGAPRVVARNPPPNVVQLVTNRVTDYGA